MITSTPRTNPLLAIIGAGGHAKVAVSSALALGRRVSCFEQNAARVGTKVLGVEVRAQTDIERLAAELGERDVDGVIGIGRNDIRKKLDPELGAHLHWIAGGLVHPTAHIERGVVVGDGTVIFAGAVVQPDARIGRHAIVNTSASIDHDCVIGDYVHIAPGTHLAGDVHVGEGAFLGVGVSVIPGKRIGAWATVGAGAVVVDDIPDHATVVGVPARPLPTKPHRK